MISKSIHFTVFGQNAMVTADRLADHPVMAIKVPISVLSPTERDRERLRRPFVIGV